MTADLIPAWVNGTLCQVDKLAVHQRGLRHLAVSVFVMRGREILLQRRAMCKYHTPGLWTNTCCTHPVWGEDPLACAKRRLQEELGITGLDLQPMGNIEYRADVGGGLTEHEVVDVFSAQANPSLSVTPNPDEVMDTRWVTVNALEAEIATKPAQFTPWLRIYLAEGLGQAIV
jgi:isopentenyl-diphosphate delta-isomerase